LTLTLLRTRVVATLVTALALAASLGSLAPASAATPTPVAATGLPKTLESMPGYVPANSCDPTAKPGTAALGKLLTTTYPGTTYGISRTCGTDALPTSEHYDGRAVDWMNSIRNPTQAAQAKALITWLMASDAAGNTYANARRLGVMYIIWNNKIWGAYSADRGWRAYSSCASHPEPGWDNTCHRNHMHLSLSWAGAMKTTSYWTKQVASVNYGPCRARDLNWAPPYGGTPRTTPCPSYPRVTAPAGASATLKTLTTYSGMRLSLGSTGPVVTAVQRSLAITASGRYDAATKAAVKRFQTAKGLYPSGNVNSATWRALLRSQAPQKS
jgi:hypothetical protein